MAGAAYRIPIVIEPYPEGGFGVRRPLFPELISEGDTFEEAVEHAEDAAEAVFELYRTLRKPLPQEAIIEDPQRGPISFDLLRAIG